MKITITKRDIDESFMGIQYLGELELGDARLIYRLYRSLRRVKKEMQAIQDVNNALIKRYREADKEGVMTLNPKMKGWAKYQEELKTLLDEPIELDVDQFSIEELTPTDDDGNPSKLKAGPLAAVWFLIADEPEKKTKS